MTLSDLAKRLSASDAPGNAGICRGCVIYKKLLNAVELNKEAATVIERMAKESEK